MTIPITSWLRAYFALQECVLESRGFIELDPESDAPTRWPRTLGSDVIAIAAVFDPVVRTLPLGHGGHGLARRWQACMEALAMFALAAPHQTYPENRAFWNTLPAVCVYLHAQAAELPAQHVWDALLAGLGRPIERRNAGPSGDGPFKHFDNVATFHDLYLEQLKYLRDQRGADLLLPDPGASGGEKLIPRTTKGDVVQLAEYWTKQLDGAKHVVGHDAIVKLWRGAVGEVDWLARTGDPNAVYPKNNAFWRALAKTAVQVSVADEAPSTTDIVLDSLKDSVKHLPENIEAGAKAAASGVAGVVGDVAHGVGKIASEAGKGMFAGFGTPLLIGAGVVGLLLIAQSRRRAAKE